MSAPEPIDEFDRLLANEVKLEKYVSLGLALEELLEKLRAKGFEAEKETLSRLLELSPSRAQLLELAAERLLDSQKRQDEQAFLRDPHNLVQPFRSVLQENRDEVERLVQAALRTQAPGGRSEATKFSNWPAAVCRDYRRCVHRASSYGHVELRRSTPDDASGVRQL